MKAKTMYPELPLKATSKKTTESTKMAKGKRPKKALITLKNFQAPKTKPIKAPGVQANKSKKVDSLKPSLVTKKMGRVGPNSK